MSETWAVRIDGQRVAVPRRAGRDTLPVLAGMVVSMGTFVLLVAQGLLDVAGSGRFLWVALGVGVLGSVAMAGVSALYWRDENRRARHALRSQASGTFPTMPEERCRASAMPACSRGFIRVEDVRAHAGVVEVDLHAEVSQSDTGGLLALTRTGSGWVVETSPRTQRQRQWVEARSELWVDETSTE